MYVYVCMYVCFLYLNHGPCTAQISKILSSFEYGVTNLFKLGKKLYIVTKKPIMKAKMVKKAKMNGVFNKFYCF